MKLMCLGGRLARLGLIAGIWTAVVLIANVVGSHVAWAGVQEWERLSRSAIEAYRQARVDAAEAALNAALDEAEQRLGPQYVVMSLDNLSELYRRTERYPEAEAMHRRALRLTEATWGANSLAVENPLKSLAGLFHRRGRYAEAFAYYDRIVQVVSKHQGDDSPALAAYLVVMAELLRLREMAEPAAREAQHALDVAERALGPDDANIPTVLTEVIWDLQILGRSEEASKHTRRLRAMLATSGSRAPAVLRSRLEFLKDVLGPRHPSVAKALADLALSLEVHGDIWQADMLCREATRILDDAGLGRAVGILPLLMQHASLLHAANRASAARLLEGRIEAIRAAPSLTP